jgi:molecular chaperone GrpE
MDDTQKKHTPRSATTGKYADQAASEVKHPKTESSKSGSSDQTAIDGLKTELEKVMKESTSNLDGWQRERAEFTNYKKRIEREGAQLRQTLTGDVIKKYLVILDDLDLALRNRPTCGEGTVWAEGIELIVRKLQAVIEAEGIERITENKVPFDPNIHEAISNEANDEFASGEVIEVVRQGYKLGERIIRPAMVRVAR